MNLGHKHIYHRLILLIALTQTACGGSGSSNPASTPAENELVSLSISGVPFDQAFHYSQYNYSATAGYLQGSIKVTAIPFNAVATVTVDGMALGADNISQSISLNEGEIFLINVIVSIAGFTDQTYTITVMRQNATDFAQRAYLKASNVEAGDQFGVSVAISGDTLVVGAYKEAGDAESTVTNPNNGAGSAGAVYVFVRTNGYWKQQTYLKARNADALDQFGVSVALDGNTLVVGANEESGDANSSATNPNNNISSAGAAYVFVRNGTSWTQQAYLKASNADPFDQFGNSVTIDGDTIAVGAVDESGDANSTSFMPNNNAGLAGAVYIFTRNDSIWTQQHYLKASNAGDLDKFGFSVALDGDTLVVGASEESGNANSTASNPNNNASFSGAVYVFLRTDSSWQQQAYIKASNAEIDDKFGTSVSLSDNTLAVGALEEAGDVNSTMANPNNNSFKAGAVYIFLRTGSSWNQQAYIKANNAETFDRFGIYVALDDDALVVSAVDEAGNANSTMTNTNNFAYPAGGGYLFEHDGINWTQQFYLKASNAEAFDQFGIQIALDGGTIVIGASKESGGINSTSTNSNNNAGEAGAVYIFQ